MAVKSASMGKLEDGREVTVYTLTNAKGTEAAFLDFGAMWYSMLVADKDGKQRDMLLGCGDLKDLPKNPGHMGEVVGRNANRIGGAAFTLNGKTYSLAVNDNGVNNLHSGPDYWRLRTWQAETGESEQGSFVCFSSILRTVTRAIQAMRMCASPIPFPRTMRCTFITRAVQIRTPYSTSPIMRILMLPGRTAAASSSIWLG